MSEANVGKRCEIKPGRVDDGSGVIQQPIPSLIGLQGVIRDYDDDAYNSSYPTGYERDYYFVEFTECPPVILSVYGRDHCGDGKLLITVDAAFVKILRTP